MHVEAPRSIVRMQDGLVRLLGNSAEGRSPLVASMLHRGPSEVASYWLQLVVSVGIATLGLVVGSSAVVIGAMLIAPLMVPIVGLAMGLASGSPFLVLRSSARIGLSVVVAVGGAAAITLSLPFHELNVEIAARASPTVLDLVTAGFCALAAVYASLRLGSDTASAAAGTSISISLVPPLCASGYGFGTMTWSVAGGAALLFLTNLVAIVVIGTIAFVSAGFNRVDVAALERQELGTGTDAPLARALARRLARLFDTRWGPALRFLMPFALLGAVYVPLRTALDEVSWEVRVRAEIEASIAREHLRMVQSRVHVERHQVDVVIVLLGKTSDAEAVRARLDAAIRRTAQVAPHIEILAIPDATAFAGLESTLLTSRVAVPRQPVVTLPSPDAQLSASQTRVRTIVEKLWPMTSVGPALLVELGTSESPALQVRVVHLGAPLNADGSESLRHAIASELGRDVRIVDAPIPAGELTVGDNEFRFVAEISAALRVAADVPDLHLCVARPPGPTRGRQQSSSAAALARALEDLLAGQAHVTTVDGAAWSMRFTPGPCPNPSNTNR